MYYKKSLRFYWNNETGHALKTNGNCLNRWNMLSYFDED